VFPSARKLDQTMAGALAQQNAKVILGLFNLI
jgi:hypothetical protein